MIKFEITIEEVGNGSLAILCHGKGEATPLEFMAGERLQAGIQKPLDEILAEYGNGFCVDRHSQGHGKITRKGA